MNERPTQNCPAAAESYIRLARSIAKQFVKEYEDFDNSDTFGNAMLALVEASKTWMPSMNTCFSTYARRCILNALISERRKQLTHRLPEATDYEPESLLDAPQQPTVDPEVMAVLLKLPEDPGEARDHQMMLERFLDGKSYMELGRARGISSMTAWNAVRRGIARIRRDHAQLLASDFVVWELPEGDLRTSK